jgi:hypothetical protein
MPPTTSLLFLDPGGMLSDTPLVYMYMYIVCYQQRENHGELNLRKHKTRNLWHSRV